MLADDDAIAGLREALRVSPNNLPLRQSLADLLASRGHYDEAEAEYKSAIGLSPDNVRLKLGLAQVFYLQGKNSAAMVIVEELVKDGKPPARAMLLQAKLFERAGEPERAVRAYRRAIDDDPAVADKEFASRLGIGAPDDSEVIEGRLRSVEGDTPGDEVDSDVERPGVTFKNVGGMDVLKEEIAMKVIRPITHPELFKAYGRSVGGGILMYGPPGCGKTHLARATAGEISAAFISVGINQILEMWIGNSERNLNAMFEQARKSRPCVLFFDEVDALAASRADVRGTGARHIINQFLAEMDGIAQNNDGVLILAATNAPWHVDAAFRRPGRFDRVLFVPPPDLTARASILRIHLAGKPVDAIDHEHIAKKTDGFSGADLKGLVDLAVEAKLREAMKIGRPQPLTTKDLTAVVGQIKPSTKEWFATARNYALYSNQSGAYDDIIKYLKS